MNLVAYTNTKKHPVHIGNKTIWPGHTREVDATLVPGYKPPEAECATTEEPNEMLALLDNSVKVVADGLVGLTDDDLEDLEEAENNGKTRKGVLAAIADVRLNRASTRQDLTDGEKFAASLVEMSDEELAAILANHEDDDKAQATIKDEMQVRIRARLEAMDTDSFIEALTENTDEELLDFSELFADSPDTLALVNAEIAKRS